MTASHPRASIDGLLQKLHISAAHLTPPAADAAFAGLHGEMSRFVEAAKTRLLATDFDWSDEQRVESQWIYSTNHRIATLGLHLSETLRRIPGHDEEETQALAGLTLLYLGEAMKWELAGATRLPREYGGLHAIMRRALAVGRHRDSLQLEAGGAPRACTLESLYFRALLLARFASGALTARQIEILDEWLWSWAPALKGVAGQPPGSTALRADLDSVDGLRRGPREESGASLYLAPAPIDAAFRALVARFHEGRTVPERGCTTAFRIEEHMAVLDLIRGGLRTSMREPMARAPRHVVDRPVELLVGLAEIMASGFATPSARMAGEVDIACRTVNLTNVSESGFALEGSQSACDMLAVGDLVAARLSPAGPLAIGRIMRSVSASTPDRVIMGVARISSAARPVRVTTGKDREMRTVPMLYVPGDDSSGFQDAYLVGSRAFEDAPPLEARGTDNVYSLRFNRVRQRGRGWVLAGFEVLGARPAAAQATESVAA